MMFCCGSALEAQRAGTRSAPNKNKRLTFTRATCDYNSSPSAATLNKRDRHQLAERAPLLEREQEVHTSAQGLSHIVMVRGRFPYARFRQLPILTNDNCD